MFQRRCQMLRNVLTCTILDDYQNKAVNLANWSSLNPHVKIRSLTQRIPIEGSLVEAVKDDDILVIMRERTLFDASLLSKLPNLKLLVTSGMRNAAIDLDYANNHGITVCGTNSLSEPAIEHTWALILGIARHVAQENQALRSNGPWQSTIGVGLSGKQLGVIGLGKIGGQVAKIGQAFGMKVVAWSPNLTKAQADAQGVTLAPSKDALLESSDFITIHLVLGDRSRNLIAGDDFKKMRPSAYLINTARAPIVNELDLIRALQDNRIAGAALDVFNVEPLPFNHPFRTLPNVLTTPHLGYVTEENYRVYFGEAVENIHAFINNSPIRLLTQKIEPGLTL